VKASAVRRLAPLAAAVALGAGLGACGGSESEGPRRGPAGGGVRPEVSGSAAQLANCGEWKAATPPQRRATVEDLRDQLTEQGDPRARSVLSDQRAYELFQRACRASYADKLRLYKLYVRAAPFEPLRGR